MKNKPFARIFLEINPKDPYMKNIKGYVIAGALKRYFLSEDKNILYRSLTKEEYETMLPLDLWEMSEIGLEAKLDKVYGQNK